MSAAATPTLLKITQAADIGNRLRLDVAIAAHFDDISRSAAQKLIDEGLVHVNGRAQKARYVLKLGDEISVTLPKAKPPQLLAENIPLDILYEDAAFIVVNKPKGMVVHPAAGHESGTLVNALLHHCGTSLSGINGVLRPGIVHRIDKDTSGILVAAKTNAAHLSLSEQLAEHSVTRIYNAIVCGGFKEDEGTIDAPIGRHPVDRKKMTVTRAGQSGRHAVSHYRVLERLGKHTLVEVRLMTGRTHQIRVHMAHIGRPLWGDAVYGPAKKGGAGQALYAQTLGFRHPDDGRPMCFDVPPPAWFSAILDKLNKHPARA